MFLSHINVSLSFPLSKINFFKSSDEDKIYILYINIYSMRRLSIVKERLISTFQSNDAILAIISNSLLLAIPLMHNFNLPPSLRICFIFSILSLTFKFKVSFSELLVGTSWLLFPLMSSIKPKKWLFLVTKLKLLSFSM